MIHWLGHVVRRAQAVHTSGYASLLCLVLFFPWIVSRADQTHGTEIHRARIQFSESVELIQSIECDFRGQSRSRSRIEAVAGNRRFQVTFSNSLTPPNLTQRTVAHVDGYQVDDHLEIDSYKVTSPIEAVVPPKYGERRVLVIFVNFTDLKYDPAHMKDFVEDMAKAGDFFKRSSRGSMSLRSTFIPEPISISLSSDNPITSTIASLASAQAETKYPELFETGYDHYIYAIPYVNSVVWAGLADVSGPKVFINGKWGWGCLVHEIGHNLGLEHAWGLAPLTSDPIGPGYEMEYGDLFDIMGNTWSAVDYNAALKARLGWIRPEETTQTVASGVYRLFRHDHAGASGQQLLNVGYGLNNYYALEYRQDPLNPGAIAGVEIRKCYRSHLAEATHRTELLDMSPLSTGGWQDSPLALGKVFSDSAQEIEITPLAFGGNPPNEYVDVKVITPDYIPRLVINSIRDGQSVTLYEPLVIKSALGLNVDHVQRAELWVGGSYVTESAKFPFDLRWVPATLGLQSISVRTLDIHGRSAEPSTMRISVKWDPEPVKTTFPGIKISHLTYGNGRWVALVNGLLNWSTNLTTWTLGSGFEPSAESVQAISYLGGVFITAESGGIIRSSQDGVRWTVQKVGRETWNAIGFFQNEWIAVGKHGAMAVTRDLQNWTQLPTLTNVDIIRVAASPEAVIAITSDARVLSFAPSFGANSWSLQSLPQSTSTRLAIWDGKGFMIVGSDGMGDRLYFSTDAEKWTSSSASATGDTAIRAMATLKDFLFVIGSRVIYQRPNQNWTRLLNLAEVYTEAVPSENSLVLVSFSAFENATTLQSFHLPMSPYEEWAAVKLPPTATESGDLDNDGLTNFDEYAFDRDPEHFDAAPLLGIRVLNPNSVGFLLSLDSPRSDARYWIDSTVDFKRWSPESILLRSTLDMGNLPHRFFRIRTERVKY